MPNTNYYDILGVTYNATSDEITVAKNKLAKKYHPDVNMQKGIDTTEKMQEILEAYAVLSDKEKRAEYDREIRGTTSIMQTFDLSKSDENDDDIKDSGFVIYWKASNQLFDIISTATELSRQKHKEKELSKLSCLALKQILILKGGMIPEKYWHPDIMNWLLFQSYKNQNYTTEYLFTLHDLHFKNDISLKNRLKIQKMVSSYLHSIKKLMKY